MIKLLEALAVTCLTTAVLMIPVIVRQRSLWAILQTDRERKRLIIVCTSGSELASDLAAYMSVSFEQHRRAVFWGRDPANLYIRAREDIHARCSALTDKGAQQ